MSQGPFCDCEACIAQINCTCRRCRKSDPGGCLVLDKIHTSQVARNIIPADQYFIALDSKGHPL